MEAMAHAYAYTNGTPTTALRFFTVYGPWGRPDMALFKFTDAILSDRPIEIYGNGEMKRDFTYVDDVVEAVVRLIEIVPVAGQPSGSSDSLSDSAPYRVVNIAGGQPIELLDFVAMIEKAVGRKARRKFLPMQPGDVKSSFADTTLLSNLTGFTPAVPAEEGVRRFVEWYRTDVESSMAG
jgi:UDP-glucuronate 4-epimerase